MGSIAIPLYYAKAVNRVQYSWHTSIVVFCGLPLLAEAMQGDAMHLCTVPFHGYTHYLTPIVMTNKMPINLILTQVGNYTTPNMNDLIVDQIEYTVDDNGDQTFRIYFNDAAQAVRYHQFISPEGISNFLIIIEDSAKKHAGIKVPPAGAKPHSITSNNSEFVEIEVGKANIEFISVTLWKGDPEHGPTGTAKVGGGG